DGIGYLAAVTNPNNETTNFQYSPTLAGDKHSGGLLTRLIDPRGGIHTFTYDLDGFLTSDMGPDGYVQTFERGGALSATNVTRTTSLGRTTTYAVSRSGSGYAESSTVRDQAGLVTVSVTNSQSTRKVTRPDGTRVTSTLTPDPRFGLDAPISAVTVSTP